MKPTPGKQYTTVSGDTLTSIANQAYGNGQKSTLIKNVNQTQIKYASESSELAAGTVLIIPVDNELKSLRQTQLANGLK